MNKVIQIQNSEQVHSLLEEHDNFIFDCDGVIYQGDKLIAQSKEFIQTVYKMKKKVLYLSNASNKSQEQFHNSLMNKLDLNEIKKEDCINARHLIQEYIRENKNNYQRVYLIGSEEFKKDLESLGIEVITDQRQILSNKEFENIIDENNTRIKMNKPIQAVIVSENNYIGQLQLNTAGVYLQDPNCVLIGCSIDNYDMIRGYKLLGPNAYIQCLKLVMTGNNCVQLGKPHVFGYKYVQPRLKQGKTIMFGDRLNTDVQFALNNHITSLLLFSGVTQPSHLDHAPQSPTYSADSLGHLFNLISQ